MLGWFRRLPGGRAISSNKPVVNARQALAEYTNYGEHLLLQGLTTEPHGHKRPPRGEENKGKH